MIPCGFIFTPPDPLLPTPGRLISVFWPLALALAPVISAAASVARNCSARAPDHASPPGSTRRGVFDQPGNIAKERKFYIDRQTRDGRQAFIGKEMCADNQKRISKPWDIDKLPQQAHVHRVTVTRIYTILGNSTTSSAAYYNAPLEQRA